jgi:hypothetical protein
VSRAAGGWSSLWWPERLPKKRPRPQAPVRDRLPFQMKPTQTRHPKRSRWPPLSAAGSLEFEVAVQQRAMECRLAAIQPGDLTRCMRGLTSSPSVHAVHFRPKHGCQHLDHCSARGDCFMGSCFCAASYAGPRCEQTTQPSPRCSLHSDDCFRSEEYGRPRVSLERWQRASWAEEGYWGGRQQSSDDHAAAALATFHGFRNLPRKLGHVCMRSVYA